MRVPKATLHEGPSGWRVRFLWKGRKPFRSLGVTKRQTAESLLRGIQDTLAAVVRGHLQIPPEVDEIDFIVSGGTAQPTSASPSVREAITEYRDSKAELDFAESVRCDTLLRVLGGSVHIRTIGLAELQNYVRKRLKQKYRGQQICGTTVGRELATFWRVREHARMLGNWTNDVDVKSIKKQLSGTLPRKPEKPPFQTYDELKPQESADMTVRQKQELWESLFLQSNEMKEVLTLVKDHSRPFLYPMVAAAIYTGARRCELCRSQVNDWDFDRGIDHIRERKRRRAVLYSYRQVDLASELVEIMQEWFRQKSAGPEAGITASYSSPRW